MRVRDAMTQDVALVHPDQPIEEAARIMTECDCGVVPVADGDRLVGMITDRDIAVRAVARGRDPDTPVRQVMTREVLYAFEDEALDDIAENMAEMKVRRLPVVNRSKRLVGIISLSDIALTDDEEADVEMALCNISTPGGLHSQGSRPQM